MDIKEIAYYNLNKSIIVRNQLQAEIKETDDKINERPVALPFSVTEFRYKLDKIKQDVAKLHDEDLPQ